jgi:proteasome lid subunit RPN8/RPN11
MADLILPASLWAALQAELRRRGRGYRESGAFLLGNPETRKVSECLYYDDLDPAALNQGFIYFNTAGYAPLWHRCRSTGTSVLADIHTHPRGWIDQSHSDRTHPMISTAGHIAFILPYFAKENLPTLAGAGLFRYLGNFTWENIDLESKEVVLQW